MNTIKIDRSDIDNARAIIYLLEQNAGEVLLPDDDQAIALQDALNSIGIAAEDLAFALDN